MLKILGVFVVIIAGFLIFVSSKNGQFRYESSDLINAPADKIYPYLTNFHLGVQWNPYSRKDPNMKTSFSGIDGQPGASMEFDGNRETGSGKLELLKIVPNESVQIKLTMVKPFNGENLVEYKLTPEGTGTRFSWAMSGDGGFMGKVIATFIDCEKMITTEQKAGIANLKAIVEAQK